MFRTVETNYRTSILKLETNLNLLRNSKQEKNSEINNLNKLNYVRKKYDKDEF